MSSNKIPRQMRRATERKLRKIKIIPSETKLTAQTGSRPESGRNLKGSNPRWFNN